MSEPISVGAHELTFEEGGPVFLRVVRTLSLPEMQTITRLIDAHRGGAPLYVINDTRQAEGMDADARRYQIRWLDTVQLAGIAVISTSLVTRTLATLLHNAHQLVSKVRVPIVFCKTEAEARAWIAQQMQLAAPG